MTNNKSNNLPKPIPPTPPRPTPPTPPRPTPTPTRDSPLTERKVEFPAHVEPPTEWPKKKP